MPLVRKWVLINQWVSGNRIMCCIPGTWHDSSTVNITIEEFCQQRKKKNLDHGYWRIVPATIEESCQWQLKNCTSHYWRIVPVAVEKSCQQLLNNRASDCWTIVPVTVEESCRPLLNNRASDCWRILSVTVGQSCQTFLKLVKEHFLRNNTFHDCYWTRSHNPLVRKRTLNHLPKTLLKLVIAPWEILVW